MKQEVLIGQTDYTVLVLLRDTVGAPKTALTEASIDIAYARVETDNDVTTTDVTPAALAALTDAHTDWGFEEVSATDHPGLYRLDIADAVFASGAWSAVVSITGTGLDPCQIEFVLVAFNPRDGVRLGLTALPNAAADAAGGLPISDAGGLDLDAQLITKINDILTDTGTTLQGELDGIQADTEDIQAKIGTPSDLGGGATVAANLSDIEAQTDDIGVAGAGLTEAGGTGDHLTAINLPNQTMDIVGNITGNLSGSVGSVTGAVGSVTAGVTLADGAITAAKIATDAIDADALAADAIAEINATVDTALADYDGPTHAELVSEINSVQADIAALENLSQAEAQAAAQAAIEANHLDHLLAAEYDPQAKPGHAGALLNEIVESDDASPNRARFTAGALEEAPTGGSAPTASEIADAVWEEAIADHSGTAGSTAEQLAAAGSAGDPWATALPGAYTSGQAGKIVGDNLNATVSSRATQTSVDDLPTNAELATALAAADDAVLAAIAALNNLSQANIRTAVGLASANLDTQLADLPTNSELTAALAAADDAVLAAVAALNDLSQADVRSAVGLASANLDTQLDALPTNAELATALAAADDAVLAAIAALNNLSAAQVNAEVDTAIADAALATAAALSTAQSAITAIKAITDALGATAAARLNLSAGQIIPGTVDDTAFATSTTEFEADDITEATADHYIGRIIVFTSGDLAGQATDITDYALAGGRGHFTVTALTESPANNATFIIV